MTTAEKVEFSSESIEGRFGHLETEVTNLKHGQESLERQLTEGFRAVFARFDTIGATKAAGVLPQLALGLTLAGLFAGMIYVYMNGQSSMLGQQIATLNSEVNEGKVAAVNSLRDVNDRLYQSQFDKGQLSQTIIDFRARLREVDDKQLAAMAALSLRIDERAKSIDDKITLAGALQQKINDAAYTSKEDYAAWRLDHVKENAYSQGTLDERTKNAKEAIKTIEERQHLNTSGVDVTRSSQEGMGRRLDLFSQRQYDAALKAAADAEKAVEKSAEQNKNETKKP